MSTILIKRLHARYHLMPAALDQQNRLDRLRDRVFEEALKRALEREGVSADDLLYIRRIHVPVHLQLSLPDEQLLANWSHRLSDSIVELIRTGSDDKFVRYRSRFQALVDCALSVARNDFRRAWAWYQLEIVATRTLTSRRLAAESLVRVLFDEPERIVPVLQVVAREGFLVPLAELIDPADLTMLVGQALRVAGSNPELVARHSRDPDGARTGRFEYLNHLAERRLRQSEIATAIIPSRYAQIIWSVNTRLAWSALALLDADPGLLISPMAEARELVQAAAVWLDRNQSHLANVENGKLSVTESKVAETDEQSARIDDATSVTKPDAVGPGRRLQGLDENDSRIKQPVSAKSQIELESPAVVSKENPDLVRVDRSLDNERNRKAGKSASWASEAEEIQGRTEEPVANPDPIIATQSTGFTEWGGLLFFIGVMDELALPDEMVNSPLYPNRTLTWILHRTALALILMPADDPAALAFAGLGPAATSPSSDDAAPSEDELSTIDSWARRMVDATRKKLNWETNDEILIDRVCRRRARVVADPGWIEIHLSLDDVSTEIRRATLDLNPNYVPWLGVVVRFIYE